MLDPAAGGGELHVAGRGRRWSGRLGRGRRAAAGSVHRRGTVMAQVPRRRRRGRHRLLLARSAPTNSSYGGSHQRPRGAGGAFRCSFVLGRRASLVSDYLSLLLAAARKASCPSNKRSRKGGMIS